MKTAFIGHRRIFAKTLPQRLIKAIEAEIKSGCLSFTMGVHGEFDSLALRACRKLRKDYPQLQIEVVLTDMRAVNNSGEGNFPYSDVNTVMYYIEEAHYKRRITYSNRMMIDACDALICYVDEKAFRSGAKTAMRYAVRKGLRIINLYDEKDKPFYGMTDEEICAKWKEVCRRASESRYKLKKPKD